MKKVFLSAALVLALSISFVSCKKSADTSAEATEAVEEAKEEVAEAVEEVKEEVAPATTTDVPSFSDPKVQEYVEAYEAYVAEYAKAAESKDMTALADLGTKGQELATKSTEALSGVSAEDAQKLTDYMTAKSNELAELAKKFTE